MTSETTDGHIEDPDLDGIIAAVESGEMSPIIALAGVTVQFFETHIPGVTPDVRDPNLWRLIGVCLAKSAKTVVEHAEVVETIIRLLKLASVL